MYKKDDVFTYKKLGIDKVIELSDEFIKTELKDSRGILYGIDVKYNDEDNKLSREDTVKAYNSGEFDSIHIHVDSWGTVNSIDLFIEKLPNRFVILQKNKDITAGKRVRENFIKNLGLIDCYDARLLTIKSKDEKSYIEEALICRNSGALRAAVIMGWTSIMHRVYSYIDRKYKAQFFTEIKKLNKNNKNFKLKKVAIIEDYQQFKDSEVLSVSKKLFLTLGLYNRLVEYLTLRNDCAHVRDWKPSESRVDSFIEEIFNLKIK